MRPPLIATLVLALAGACGAAAAQTPSASLTPVVAGNSAEIELGRTLAAALLGEPASRDRFALERTGPRFAEQLGGDEGVRAAYADIAGTVAGGRLKDIGPGPNSSIILIFEDSTGQERKLHVVRGVSMADGRLKVGGFAFIP